MKTREKIALFLLVLFVFSALNVTAQGFEVNVEQSKIEWIGKKIGGQHNGTINLQSGSLIMEGYRLAGGEFVIDMNTIVCEDLTNESLNNKLVDHLKSDDFFGVEIFPVSQLALVSTQPLVDGTTKIKGNLTIKGITHPIEFDAFRTEVGYRAEIIVDRSRYNVRYGSKSFFSNIGDNAIDDEFIIKVNLVQQK
ncbi:MAG: YceI family protein [Bacteroidales bacterium]|nr:YceI family protein [Bacteroidales bacterium]MDD2323031.1 YceI family protein [Bacteroidales bacterium]MDD3010140.1 YceI family protein [Bacteroidales bacterium]MDD3961150.1 YceI family protein [Bacteroidales bacterium]MDY0286310.1 YceI family protein [Bacteroidales bacterium]